MKPHIFAQMVNEVRDLARQYGQVEQFRCRVADLLGKYINVEHNSKGVPEQTEAPAVVVPDLEDGDDVWKDAAFIGSDYSAGLRDGYDIAKSRARAIPTDRVLGDGMVAVPREELHQLRGLESCARAVMAYDGLLGTEERNRLKRLDALRANQGGANE